jgi:hypothetical protein
MQDEGRTARASLVQGDLKVGAEGHNVRSVGDSCHARVPFAMVTTVNARSAFSVFTQSCLA